MRPLTPYEDATAEIEMQEPMPDAPPVSNAMPAKRSR